MRRIIGGRSPPKNGYGQTINAMVKKKTAWAAITVSEARKPFLIIPCWDLFR